MTSLTHDGPVPLKPIRLSAFAKLREPGGIHNIAKSAVRALDVLEFLIAAQSPLRAIDIVRHLNLSPSSTSQILKTLVDGGYLIFDPFLKRYDLSARLLRLGPSLRRRYFRPQAISGLLRTVQKASGLLIVLAASQGYNMQVMDACLPPDEQLVHLPDAWRAEVLSFSIGKQMPMFGTCSGAAWLSSQSEKNIIRAASKCRRDLGEEASNLKGILEGIQQVKDQGYAAGAFIVDDSLWSVAVPIPPAANGTVMVLSACGPREMVENRSFDIASLMKEEIHHYLG